MSTRGEQSGTTSPDTADRTERLSRPGTQSGSSGTMRDGAMARTTPRRDLSGAAARARAVTRAGSGTRTAPEDERTGRRSEEPTDRTERPERPERSERSDDQTERVSRPAAAGQSRPAGQATRARVPREGSTARPAQPRTRAPRRTGPRRVRLTVQRIDPWSVLKISFLVSVALGIAGVVMVAVLWTVLNGMNVFSTVNDLIVEVTSGESGAAAFDLMEYVGFGRVMALSVVIGVINVVLLTALATLTAFLYNVCAALVGGGQLTLSDE